MLHCGNASICAQDLYVGATLSVFGRIFELLDADEYTYTYMENNSHVFIMADADATLTGLRAQARDMTHALMSMAAGCSSMAWHAVWAAMPYCMPLLSRMPVHTH